MPGVRPHRRPLVGRQRARLVEHRCSTRRACRCRAAAPRGAAAPGRSAPRSRGARPPPPHSRRRAASDRACRATWRRSHRQRRRRCGRDGRRRPRPSPAPAPRVQQVDRVDGRQRRARTCRRAPTIARTAHQAGREPAAGAPARPRRAPRATPPCCQKISVTCAMPMICASSGMSSRAQPRRLAAAVPVLVHRPNRLGRRRATARGRARWRRRGRSGSGTAPARPRPAGGQLQQRGAARRPQRLRRGRPTSGRSRPSRTSCASR